jgi:hypothetical protein
MNPSTKPTPESPVSLSAAAELDKVYVKIANRIIPFPDNGSLVQVSSRDGILPIRSRG